jgi:hypothetical protein
VAEKKAKEINQAYEHFRKKFKKPWTKLSIQHAYSVISWWSPENC